MNALTNRIALIAASALAFGTIAFGQTPVLKAQIPFAFQASTANLPAGTYTIRPVHVGGTSNAVALRNEASSRTTYISRQSTDTKAPASAAVLFNCGEKGCSLMGVRQADGTVSYYGKQHSKRDKEVALVAVPLNAVKAD